MFNNVGRSIKNFIKIVTGILIFLSVLIGIIILILFDSEGRGGLGFLMMLIVIGVGCFTAWLSGVVLYAYGEITDGVMAIKNKICSDGTGGQPADNTSNDKAGASNSDPAEKTNWTCYSCGTVNPHFRAYCVKCGVSHSWSEWRTNEK